MKELKLTSSGKLFLFFTLTIILIFQPSESKALDFSRFLSPSIKTLKQAQNEQNTADGSFWLGAHYLKSGQSSDRHTALQYFKASSSMGNPNAAAVVGFLLLDPNDERSIKSAREWFVRASNDGSPLGFYGVVNIRAMGLKVDGPDDLDLLKRSWDGGIVDAGFMYANRLRKERPGKDSDLKSYDIYKEACDSGDIDSCVNFGVMSITSLYIPTNKSLGFGYLLFANDMGSTYAPERLRAYAPYLSEEELNQAIDLAVTLSRKAKSKAR